MNFIVIDNKNKIYHKTTSKYIYGYTLCNMPYSSYINGDKIYENRPKGLRICKKCKREG